MPVISISSTLRDRLGEEGADDLVDLINRATEERKEDVLTLVAEKYERRLTEETERLRRYINNETIQLDKRITEVAASLDQRITEETQQLRVQLAETKADLLRWMSIFWVGQVATILGIMFVFFK